jgi:hypothetical protein
MFAVCMCPNSHTLFHSGLLLISFSSAKVLINRTPSLPHTTCFSYALILSSFFLPSSNIDEFTPFFKIQYQQCIAKQLKVTTSTYYSIDFSLTDHCVGYAISLSNLVTIAMYLSDHNYSILSNKA